MDYRILGNVAMVLLFSQMALFVFRRIVKYGKIRDKNFLAFVRFLKPTHVVTGFALVGVGLTHGVIALGQVELHTGWILWIVIVFSMVGFLVRKRLGKKWIAGHRIVGFVILGLFFLHRFFPWIL